LVSGTISNPPGHLFGLTLKPLVAIKADLVCDRNHAPGRTGLVEAMPAKGAVLAKKPRDPLE
jgi:hypothetical protein